VPFGETSTPCAVEVAGAQTFSKIFSNRAKRGQKQIKTKSLGVQEQLRGDSLCRRRTANIVATRCFPSFIISPSSLRSPRKRHARSAKKKLSRIRLALASSPRMTCTLRIHGIIQVKIEEEGEERNRRV